MKKIKFIKKLLILATAIPVFACGQSEVTYVSKGDLEYDHLYLINEPYIKQTNYGAIKFQEANATADEGKLFLLQKKKGVYQAETMFKNHKDKKYFFSLGIDYKNQAPTMGVRVEF